MRAAAWRSSAPRFRPENSKPPGLNGGCFPEEFRCRKPISRRSGRTDCAASSARSVTATISRSCRSSPESGFRTGRGNSGSTGGTSGCWSTPAAAVTAPRSSNVRRRADLIRSRRRGNAISSVTTVCWRGRSGAAASPRKGFFRWPAPRANAFRTTAIIRLLPTLSPPAGGFTARARPRRSPVCRS